MQTFKYYRPERYEEKPGHLKKKYILTSSDVINDNYESLTAEK